MNLRSQAMMPPSPALPQERLVRRQVQSEWLDGLDPADARAQRSRRDLQRVNAWMGNVRKVVHALKHAPLRQAPGRLVELGAGDGTFLLQVARRLHARWPRVQAVTVDRLALLSPETQQGFASLGWTVQAVQADVFDWLRIDSGAETDVFLSNLFLHHFASERLRLLLEHAAQHAVLFVACEPERSRLALLGARLLWLIGCQEVTRHDAVISVRAGFGEREVSDLWPEGGDWQLTERAAGPFSHLFQARRAGDGEGRHA